MIGLGGLHSANCVMGSVDFADVERMQRERRWDEAGVLFGREAQALVAAGVELLVLFTNTMHEVADAIAGAIDIPFVHIADTTADAFRGAGLTTVGLLATAYTMEQDFYVGRLRDMHSLDVLVRAPADRAVVHRVIYAELCVGVVGERAARHAGARSEGHLGQVVGRRDVELLRYDVGVQRVGPDAARLAALELRGRPGEHEVTRASARSRNSCSRRVLPIPGPLDRDAGGRATVQRLARRVELLPRYSRRRATVTGVRDVEIA